MQGSNQQLLFKVVNAAVYFQSNDNKQDLPDSWSLAAQRWQGLTWSASQSMVLCALPQLLHFSSATPSSPPRKYLPPCPPNEDILFFTCGLLLITFNGLPPHVCPLRDLIASATSNPGANSTVAEPAGRDVRLSTSRVTDASSKPYFAKRSVICRNLGQQ